MPPIIITENLTKIYPGGVKAVDSISIEVDEGEIYGFLGPNGAGKTTTIMMLITLLKPTSGKAVVCGLDLNENPSKIREKIGYVSQDVAVDENLTGRENLVLQGRFYHLPKRLLERRVEEVLEMVELVDRADDLVSTYSGGMRKRLDIAGGLLHRPEILFVDEPTLGLDIQTRRRIWEYLQKLREEEGMTIFLTTHYMEEADMLCDRVSIIDHGKIMVVGKPDELKSEIGGDVLTIRFTENRNDRIEEAIDSIKRLPFVERIMRVKEIYSVIVKDGERAMPKIFSLTEEIGVSIESISMKRPTLDDVFLSYTGRALRDTVVSRDQILRERVRMRRLRG